MHAQLSDDAQRRDLRGRVRTRLPGRRRDRHDRRDRHRPRRRPARRRERGAGPVRTRIFGTIAAGRADPGERERRQRPDRVDAAADVPRPARRASRSTAARPCRRAPRILARDGRRSPRARTARPPLGTVARRSSGAWARSRPSARQVLRSLGIPPTPRSGSPASSASSTASSPVAPAGLLEAGERVLASRSPAPGRRRAHDDRPRRRARRRHRAGRALRRRRRPRSRAPARCSRSPGIAVLRPAAAGLDVQDHHRRRPRSRPARSSQARSSRTRPRPCSAASPL